MKKSSNFLELMINHNYIDKTVHQYLVKPGLSKFSREELLFLNDVYQNNPVSYYDERYVFKDIQKVLRRIEQHYFIGEDAFFNRNFLLAVCDDEYFIDTFFQKVLALDNRNFDKVIYFLIESGNFEQIQKKVMKKDIKLPRFYGFLFKKIDKYSNDNESQQSLIEEVNHFIDNISNLNYKTIDDALEKVIVDCLTYEVDYKENKKVPYFISDEELSNNLFINNIGFPSSYRLNNEFINALLGEIISKELYVTSNNFMDVFNFKYKKYEIAENNIIYVYDYIKEKDADLFNVIKKNIFEFIKIYNKFDEDYKEFDFDISYTITNKIDNFIEINKLMDKKYDDLRLEYFLSADEIDNIFINSIKKLNSNIDKQIIFQRLQSLADDLDKNKGSFIDIINMIQINYNELDELDKLVDFSKFHITDLKDIKNKTAKNYIEKKLNNSEETQHDSKT